MKSEFRREIALLSLPFLVLGGTAWWRANGGGVSMLQGAPSDLSSGATRLEVGAWHDLPLRPAQVAREILTKKRVTLWQGGLSPVPDGTRRLAFDLFPIGEAHLIFRRGAKWQTAPGRASRAVNPTHWKKSELDAFAARCDLEYLIRLDSVPRDADEVRLRGQYITFSRYESGACGRAAPDPRWKTYPSGECEFVLRSKPFDVRMKMP